MEAALIAEELMGQIAASEYADLGVAFPPQTVGQFLITRFTQQRSEDLPGLGVRVLGTQVRVTVLHSGTVLAEAELFIPEPQS
ncbi:MAG: hypothetical protein V3S08_03755, partial [Phycisphaerales bacterium]